LVDQYFVLCKNPLLINIKSNIVIIFPKNTIYFRLNTI
jgi:hypothetical protein